MNLIFMHGELGHIKTRKSVICSCGGKGCLEAVDMVKAGIFNLSLLMRHKYQTEDIRQCMTDSLKAASIFLQT